MAKSSSELQPIGPQHAADLFPLIFQTAVTDTILWDGPTSLDALRAGFEQHMQRPAHELPRVFAITHQGRAVGTCDLRLVRGDYRAGIGLYVGIPYQGLGLGTFAIGELLKHAFLQFAHDRVDATVFVGNVASRRALEKNGFVFEGTLRAAAKKRGQLIDEWQFGITRADYLRDRQLGAAPE